MIQKTPGKNIPLMRTPLFLLVLILSGAAVYANSLHGPFVFDDLYFIVNDYAIRMTDFSWQAIQKAALEGKPQDRYLPNISFAVNYYFGGLDTFGYHVVNIGIHLITGVFLFFLFRNTLILHPPPKSALSPDVIAFFAALLWIVHPVGTQSVTYICQRMASMAALFYVLSLLLYIKGRISMIQAPKSRTAPVLYFAGCLLAGLCALATKENAGTLPIVILLFEWFFFQNLKLKFSRGQLILAGFGILAFCAVVFWYMGENPFNRILNSYKYRDFTLTERVMTQWRIVIYYISLFFYSPPSRLNLDHDYPLSVSPLAPATTLICLTAIIGLFAIAVLSANKHRLIAFSILWFFITQATESTIIGIELIFEHRTYIPFMMISLMVVTISARLIRYRSLHVALLILAGIVFSAWTQQRNSAYHSPVSFWSDALQKSPRKHRPNFQLGLAFLDEGRITEAIAQFKKAIAINPHKMDAYNNLGNAMIKIGETVQAILWFEKTLTMKPDHVEARNNLANALMARGNIKEAIGHLRLILEKHPENVEANLNLAAALARMGNLDAALIHCRRALQSDPLNPEAHNNMGAIYAGKGMVQEARTHFIKALELRPGYPSAQNNLRLLERMDRP